MALWAVEAMMEGGNALHAYPCLPCLHLHACCYMAGFMFDLNAQNRRMSSTSIHGSKVSTHSSFIHACMHYSYKMPFAERGSMVRLLADVQVPKVGF